MHRRRSKLTSPWLAATLVLALAAAASGSQADSIAAADRPLYLEVAVADRAEVRRLEQIGDVDGVEGGHVRLFTSQAGLEQLRRLGFSVTLLPDPGLAPGAWSTDRAATMASDWASYPSWSAYVDLMNALAAACGTTLPDVCRLVDLGATTNEVRPHRLLALKFSANPDLEEDEPQILLTSSMHGDETAGFVTLLRLADDLVHSYDPASADPDNERLTALLDRTELWIQPLANPDGTYFASDTGPSGAIRYFTTAAGGNAWVDPNRNFPDPEEGAHPDGNPYWRETTAMIDLGGRERFALAANFHGGAEVVSYPWDTWTRRHPDDNWYVALSRAYADQAQADGPASYMNDLDDGITNGWDWYEVDGGRQDFMNAWGGAREVTIELSAQKLVSAASLPTYWSANRAALLGFAETALEGIRGLVTDGDGRPLAATVEVVGRDADGSQVRTDPEVGDYHRLLLPGSYTLRFTALGHQVTTIAAIDVAAGDATRIDVVLAPLPDLLFADGFESGGATAW